MQKRIDEFYWFILSKRDFFSFFAGIIVSGYVVEISLIPKLNFWHLVAIFLGIFMGILLFFLVSIGENFEDNLKALRSNNPNSSNVWIKQQAWISINSDNKANKIFGILPKKWLPLNLSTIPIFLVFGILSLNCANNLIEEHSSCERAKMMNQIDSIFRSQINEYTENCQILEDSLFTQTKNINFHIKQIDSLVRSHLAKR